MKIWLKHHPRPTLITQSNDNYCTVVNIIERVRLILPKDQNEKVKTKELFDIHLLRD